ncbi:hypothetical protein ENUP19_0388G0010 [Entamoeba nuttalli]|uniref:Deacetylase sirtuin-type domain-containing protein n=1 Tax=Entamoeba nuttalli TaxID=412467 RepID=A0ABQ0DAN4_9EUKA
MSIEECQHLPKQIYELKLKTFSFKCECGQLTECVCVTCRKPMCEECREKHEHPVSCGTKGGYCKECKREIPKEKVQKLYDTLPLFLPKNAKGFGLFMKYRKPSNVVVMAGAGISTSAGIPDFRTPGTGLYDNLEKYNLPFPTAVFDINYFKSNPEPFYTIASELMPGLGKYFPTPTHYFLTYLNKLGYISMLFTQNIDGLEIQSGFPNEKLVMAHGNYYSGHCLKCKKSFKQSYFIDNVRDGKVCYCDSCKGLVKPDIVFFGEGLPQQFFNNFEKVEECDLLIVLGTSLLVQPFASLIDLTKKNTPRVYINMKDFNSFNKINDLQIIGKCDESILEIAEYMGIGDDFKKYLEEQQLKLN